MLFTGHMFNIFPIFGPWASASGLFSLWTWTSCGHRRHRHRDGLHLRLLRCHLGWIYDIRHLIPLQLLGRGRRVPDEAPG